MHKPTAHTHKPTAHTHTRTHTHPCTRTHTFTHTCTHRANPLSGVRRVELNIFLICQGKTKKNEKKIKNNVAHWIEFLFLKIKSLFLSNCFCFFFLMICFETKIDCLLNLDGDFLTLKSMRRGLGHLCLHLLICSHRSLICLLRTARFGLARSVLAHLCAR